MRMVNAVNYKNDFALGTWAPLNLCEGKTYHIDIFVDKCSVELFVDGGRIAMTNLVFPTKPYDSVKFFSENGQSAFKQIKVYKLKNVKHGNHEKNLHNHGSFADFSYSCCRTKDHTCMHGQYRLSSASQQ